MKFPASIAVALGDVDPSRLPGRLAQGDLECAGAKFHSPGPLALHPVKIYNEEVLLCGTCRDNAVVLQLVMATKRDDVPWRREIGNRMRALLMPKESDG